MDKRTNDPFDAFNIGGAPLKPARLTANLQKSTTSTPAARKAETFDAFADFPSSVAPITDAFAGFTPGPASKPLSAMSSTTTKLDPFATGRSDAFAGFQSTTSLASDAFAGFSTPAANNDAFASFVQKTVPKKDAFSGFSSVAAPINDAFSSFPPAKSPNTDAFSGFLTGPAPNKVASAGFSSVPIPKPDQVLGFSPAAAPKIDSSAGFLSAPPSKPDVFAGFSSLSNGFAGFESEPTRPVTPSPLDGFSSAQVSSTGATPVDPFSGFSSSAAQIPGRLNQRPSATPSVEASSATHGVKLSVGAHTLTGNEYKSKQTALLAADVDPFGEIEVITPASLTASRSQCSSVAGSNPSVHSTNTSSGLSTNPFDDSYTEDVIVPTQVPIKQATSAPLYSMQPLTKPSKPASASAAASSSFGFSTGAAASSASGLGDPFSSSALQLAASIPMDSFDGFTSGPTAVNAFDGFSGGSNAANAFAGFPPSTSTSTFAAPSSQTVFSTGSKLPVAAGAGGSMGIFSDFPVGPAAPAAGAGVRLQPASSRVDTFSAFDAFSAVEDKPDMSPINGSTLSVGLNAHDTFGAVPPPISVARSVESLGSDNTPSPPIKPTRPQTVKFSASPIPSSGSPGSTSATLLDPFETSPVRAPSAEFMAAATTTVSRPQSTVITSSTGLGALAPPPVPPRPKSVAFGATNRLTSPLGSDFDSVVSNASSVVGGDEFDPFAASAFDTPAASTATTATVTAPTASAAPAASTHRAHRPISLLAAPIPKKKDGFPPWRRSYFSELFLEGVDYDDAETLEQQRTKEKSSVEMLHKSMRAVRDALFRVSVNTATFADESHIIQRAVEVFDACEDIFDRFPTKVADNEKFLSFLGYFMGRVRSLSAGGVIIAPIAWATPPTEGGAGAGGDMGALVILHRAKEGTDADYSFSVVNTNPGSVGGLEYHPVKYDTQDSSLLRCLSLEVNNVLNYKVTNTAFWYESIPFLYK